MDPKIKRRRRLNWRRLFMRKQAKTALQKCEWLCPEILWQWATINTQFGEDCSEICVCMYVTHNLWMRVTMVLKAAWTSAAEQVDTMGWACSCSNSATYCTETHEMDMVSSWIYKRQGWKESRKTLPLGYTESRLQTIFLLLRSFCNNVRKCL